MKLIMKKVAAIILLLSFLCNISYAENESLKSLLGKCNESELKQLTDIVGGDATSIISNLSWAYGNAITGPYRSLFDSEVPYSTILRSVARRMKITVYDYWDDKTIEGKIFENYLEAMWSGLTAEQKQQVLDNIAKELKDKGVDPSKIKGLVASTSISALIFTVTSLGFTPYIALTTFIHAIGVVIGVTFPFVVYTSATYLLSVLTGPVGWGLAIAAGVWYFFNTNYTTLTKFTIAKHVIELSKS
ncbi:MAG: hypothetical protein PHW04_11875 [Candidatus Wallbacteria bacterium]|nr:hypothetical protein [Candidatus Wallbacteria bacterium]